MALVSAAVGILAIRLPRRWVLLESCLFDSLNLNRFQVARQAAWPEYAPALLSNTNGFGCYPKSGAQVCSQYQQDAIQRMNL